MRPEGRGRGQCWEPAKQMPKFWLLAWGEAILVCRPAVEAKNMALSPDETKILA